LKLQVFLLSDLAVLYFFNVVGSFSYGIISLLNLLEVTLFIAPSSRISMVFFSYFTGDLKLIKTLSSSYERSTYLFLYSLKHSSSSRVSANTFWGDMKQS